MKFAKSILTATGAVILAGLILALLVPKAAHAITATLVQVVNTNSNPVPTQGVMPGAAFSQQCVVNGSGTCALSPPVPSGYQFHSTFQSTYLTCSTPIPAAAVYWAYTTAGIPASYYNPLTQNIPLNPPDLTTTSYSTTDHDLYLDANSVAFCSINLIPLNLGAPVEQLTCQMSGYLTH